MTTILNSAEVAAALFNSAQVVDELGLIKAQIAELEAKEKALTDALKATGATSFAGTFYDATVSTSERKSLNREATEAYFGAALPDDCFKTSKIVTLKLTAKK